MGRWTYQDDDPYRLPEGVTRVGYDADTGQYTFQDEMGRLYEGEPYVQYGKMRPIGRRTEPSRPLCNTDHRAPQSESTGSPKSFKDILPSEMMASSPTSSEPPSPTTTPARSRFIKAVRSFTSPAMQSVVQKVMRRSTTLGQRSRNVVDEEQSPKPTSTEKRQRAPSGSTLDQQAARRTSVISGILTAIDDTKVSTATTVPPPRPSPDVGSRSQPNNTS